MMTFSLWLCGSCVWLGLLGGVGLGVCHGWVWCAVLMRLRRGGVCVCVCRDGKVKGVGGGWNEEGKVWEGLCVCEGRRKGLKEELEEEVKDMRKEWMKEGIKRENREE